MIAEAIDAIIKMAKPELLKSDTGKIYSTGALVEQASEAPVPNPIKAFTLQAIVDYALDGIDDINPNDNMILVDTNCVSIVTGALKPFLNRGDCLISTYDGFNFQFGRFYSVEDIIIALQSMFADNEGKTQTMKLASNISDVKDLNVSDDGVSQKVTLKAGVVRKEEGDIKDAVVLIPRRIFPEVEQVGVPMIRRIKAGRDGELPTFALFEADGGAWKITARARIKNWLNERLPDFTIIS